METNRLNKVTRHVIYIKRNTVGRSCNRCCYGNARGCCSNV